MKDINKMPLYVYFVSIVTGIVVSSIFVSNIDASLVFSYGLQGGNIIYYTMISSNSSQAWILRLLVATTIISVFLLRMKKPVMLLNGIFVSVTGALFAFVCLSFESFTFGSHFCAGLFGNYLLLYWAFAIAILALGLYLAHFRLKTHSNYTYSYIFVISWAFIMILFGPALAGSGCTLL